MTPSKVYGALFSGNRAILGVIVLASALIVALFVAVLCNYKKASRIQDGSEPPSSVVDATYYTSLALMAVLVAALLVGAVAVGRPTPYNPALFAMIELPVLALAFSTVALLYPSTRGGHVSSSAAASTFIVFFLFNLVWFGALQFSGVIDYAIGTSASSPPPQLDSKGLMAFLLGGGLDAAKKAEATRVVAVVCALLLFALFAALFVGAAVVKAAPESAFAGELAGYVLIPVVPLLVVLTWMRQLPLQQAVFYVFVDAVARAALYTMLQFSGATDKFLGVMDVDWTGSRLQPHCGA